MGKRAFRRENAAFRDAARRLSGVRDAKVLVEALDDLARTTRASDRPTLMRLRSILTSSQLRARRQVVGSKRALEPVVEALRSARKRIEPSDGRRGWPVIGDGLRRVHRAGRRALVLALRKPTMENFHEVRKQAKYLWHALQILEPIQPVKVGRSAALAHELSNRLGKDHDLAMLRGKLASARARLPRRSVESIMERMDRRRKKLQREATALGRRLYRQPPREFVRGLERDWRAWRSKLTSGIHPSQQPDRLGAD